MSIDRVLLALAALATYVFFCAWIWRRHAARQIPVAAPGNGGIMVAYASQTGHARLLAERTVQGLVAAGHRAWMAAIDQIDTTRLAATSHALFIVSTTGEGDAPDHASRFVRRVMAGPVGLTGLSFGLLALGDRSYAKFCAFGHTLEDWLRRQGAVPLFDSVLVDNGDAAALSLWQQRLGAVTGAAIQPALIRAPFADWVLADRRLLNPDSAGEGLYHLRLTPPDDATWQAGDIAEILPMADDAGDQFRTRDYSIASVPADGTLDLVVRLARRDDGSLGLASGWLTSLAAIGAPVRLRVRRNTGFHAPVDDCPLILIGNGSGIAGLRAHLRARALAGRRSNWLLFGERNSAHDRPFADELALWQENGHLSHLDLAFSRDVYGGGYVQDALARASDRLRAWVDDGAVLLVCGSRDGMGSGVDAVLRVVLGDERVDGLIEQGRYRRDVY